VTGLNLDILALGTMLKIIFLRTSYRNAIINGTSHHYDVQNQAYTEMPGSMGGYGV
jgi:hypothetical protein